MTRDIYLVKDLLNRIETISDEEENKYTDIPNWDGQIDGYTERAVMLVFNDGSKDWFPISHLRVAGDAQSIYASNWILGQKERR